MFIHKMGRFVDKLLLESQSRRAPSLITTGISTGS